MTAGPQSNTTDVGNVPFPSAAAAYANVTFSATNPGSPPSPPSNATNAPNSWLPPFPDIQGVYDQVIMHARMNPVLA